MALPRSSSPLLRAILLLLGLLVAAAIAPAAALEALPADVERRANAALAQAAQAQGKKTTGCGTAPLVILYGANPPSSLSSLVEEQPPLPRLPPLGSGADVELHAASANGSCLASVRRIRGTLLLWDDGTLPSSPLSILSNLQRVDESLIIYGSSASSSLTLLSGLGSLEAVGNLALARLPRLASLQGLGNLKTISGGLVLWRLPELQTLDDMAPIGSIQERLWIENTPKLLSLGRLPPLPPVAPVTTKITKQQQQQQQQQQQDQNQIASGLSALRSVALDVHIQNTDLPSLELPFLASVGGEVALLNNKRLASTQGLRSLASAFAVALIGNDLLADVDGFARLTELKGDLSLVRNRVIQSVNGFSRLSSVGLTVDVSSNPALRSLDGFRGLATVGQTLNVAFNPSLEALRGFGSLTSVGADLIIRNNTQLKELTDLGASLRSVGTGPGGGSLLIEGNTALASLAPLASPPLQVVRGPVRVRDNGIVGGPDVAALEALAQPGFVMAVPGVTAPAATTAPTPMPTTPATAAPVVATPAPRAAVVATPMAATPPTPTPTPTPAPTGQSTFVNALLSG